jgi:hypothetical protein
MNHYEELAVAQDASPDEIHQAYRALARLLHPDNHSDPKLKSAAERQMVRLNQILATLTDPQKRRKYDDSLRNTLAVREAVHPPRPAAPLLLKRQLPWILACCILAGAALWYWRSNEAGDPPAPARPAQPAQIALPESSPPKSANRPLKRSPAHSKPAPPSSHLNPGDNFTPAEPANPLPDPAQPAAPLSRPAAKTPGIPAQPQPATPDPPAQPQTAVTPPASAAFAGRWFYTAGSHDTQAPGLYPPEFIEFFLSDQQGVLSGKYWARYRIPDKPVSPEVQFRVNGPSQKTNTTVLNWVSDDGANGQIKVVLHGSNSMEVTWWTTAFGRQTALTSGTALLVRQLAR